MLLNKRCHFPSSRNKFICAYTICAVKIVAKLFLFLGQPKIIFSRRSHQPAKNYKRCVNKVWLVWIWQILKKIVKYIGLCLLTHIGAQYTFLKSVSHFPYVDAISCCCYFKLCCWQSQMTMKYLCALSYPVFSLASQPLCSWCEPANVLYKFLCARVNIAIWCARTAGSAAFDPHQQSFPLEINIAAGEWLRQERI